MEFNGYPVTVRVQHNARRIILRSRPGAGAFEVTVPPWVTEEELARFLTRNRAWMDTYSRELTLWTPRLEAGERHLLLGSYVTLGSGGIPAGAAFVRLRTEALRTLVEARLAFWGQRTGLRPLQVRYREMKSRWGSCSCDKRSILFNTRLGLLPPELIDSVVLHELMHLRHPNHSARFYWALQELMPDYRARSARLKTFDLRPLPPAETAAPDPAGGA